MKLQILNGNVLLPTGLKKVDVEINDGIISKFARSLKTDTSAIKIYADDKYILPGFIDLHTNGTSGFDLTNGLYNVKAKSFSTKKENYLSGLNNALKDYANHGTTLVGFSTLEASITKMKNIFKLIAEYKRESTSPYKAIFYGIYMEGTFMKDKKYCGAHNPKYFFEPSISLFNEFQEAAEDNIKIVNVVPEWGESALELIEYLTSKNIICAAGHTGATGKQYSLAIDKGLNLAIHVLNGPSSTSFKSFDEGGALEAFLKSDRMYLEIIPDGYHVDKAYALDILKKKGTDKCIAISDSMFVSNMKHINEFEMNGVSGKISKNGKYIQLAGKGNENLLFGSVLTMDQAFSNLLTWFTMPIEGVWNRIHKPFSFEKALLETSKMCSANPAKLLGIYSGKSRKLKSIRNSTGSIELGKCGDIVISEIIKNKNGYNLNVKDVILKGKLVSNLQP